jgi:hypothetical protein
MVQALKRSRRSLLAIQCDEKEAIVIDQRSNFFVEDQKTMLAKSLFVVLIAKVTIVTIGQFLK